MASGVVLQTRRICGERCGEVLLDEGCVAGLAVLLSHCQGIYFRGLGACHAAPSLRTSGRAGGSFGQSDFRSFVAAPPCVLRLAGSAHGASKGCTDVHVQGAGPASTPAIAGCTDFAVLWQGQQARGATAEPPAPLRPVQRQTADASGGTRSKRSNTGDKLSGVLS